MSGASLAVEVKKRLKDQIATRPSTPPRDWQLEERLYLKRVKFQLFYKSLPRTGYSSDFSSLHRLYSRCRSVEVLNEPGRQARFDAHSGNRQLFFSKRQSAMR
jgi:hypothetical protein